MRFAPPNPLRIADRASGLNSLSVRGHNERLVLSLLLQSESTTRLEIGEKTGLSAQTISVIVRSLEHDGLVIRGEAQRGRVGPPTTPLLLNPDGAYSVGVSIGYRRTYVVLVDFVGSVRYRQSLSHDGAGNLQEPNVLIDEVMRAIATLPMDSRGRIAGIGLGIPAPVGEMQLASSRLSQELEQATGLPVFVQNDIAAATSGESLFGAARQLQDYLFFYLGAKLHSRLVLNHQIYNVNSSVSHDVGALALERSLSGLPGMDAIWTDEGLWRRDIPKIAAWRDECIDTLVNSVDALSQFVEVKTLVLSSFVPHFVVETLCSGVRDARPSLNALPGITSTAPKAVGAASLPYSLTFMLD